MDSSESYGRLYLIPSLLGDVAPLEVLPLSVKKVIDLCNHFVVENEKTARAFIKKVHPGKSQDKLQMHILNKYTQPEEWSEFLAPCEIGQPVGLLSEAGAPGVADPGAEVVGLGHQKGIRVVPLSGPSSILLALMASGLNGQSFCFHGYLPIEKPQRKKALLRLQKLAGSGQAQIFMETPYRNHNLLDDLLQHCAPESLLCIARQITTPEEMIKTAPVHWWKKNLPDLEKKPCIFILGQAV